MKVRNEGKMEGKELKDPCKITIEDKSYYIDVSYNVPDTDEDTVNYSSIIDNIIIQLRQKYNLSSRGFDVLTFLVNGLNNTDISDKLFVSLSTVKKHTTTTYRKLGSEGRHQLMKIIVQEL